MKLRERVNAGSARIARLWRKYNAWRLRHLVSIEPCEGGFNVLAYRRVVGVRWESISQIVAYKRDLFTTDLICLAIHTDETITEINEEMSGYEEVLSEIQREFAISPEWLDAVIVPAFAPNVTVLYESKCSAHPSGASDSDKGKRPAAQT